MCEMWPRFLRQLRMCSELLDLWECPPPPTTWSESFEARRYTRYRMNICRIRPRFSRYLRCVQKENLSTFENVYLPHELEWEFRGKEMHEVPHEHMQNTPKILKIFTLCMVKLSTFENGNFWECVPFPRTQVRVSRQGDARVWAAYCAKCGRESRDICGCVIKIKVSTFEDEYLPHELEWEFRGKQTHGIEKENMLNVAENREIFMVV